MKKAFYVLLILVVLLSFTTYKLWIKEPQTLVMCNTGAMIAIRVKPSSDAQIIYALSKYDKIWWSGARTEKWLFIDYIYGSGWIETSAELGDCPPETKPPSIFDVRFIT